MLKSLYSGVSGLQSHQMAMDVESNNIANVNTIGFKYSRANFSDMLAQTKSIATAPQGDAGGKNPVQVGLGATISSTTRIFSQGAIQKTEKVTDVAIEGDGFFIVSADYGNSYKYTRAGDFKFDAGGNFVDNNGFIVQGWLRNEVTGEVDSTAPLTNVNIAPGLTTPASATADVVLKANLNSGRLIENSSPAYEVSSTPVGSISPAVQAIDENGNPIISGDLGVMYNEQGEAFNLQEDQGVWASFKSSEVTGAGAVAGGAVELSISFTLDDGTVTPAITTQGGDPANTPLVNANRYISRINDFTATTGIKASYDSLTQAITLTNTNSDPAASHNINFTQANDNTGLGLAGSDKTAYKYQYDPVSTVAPAGFDKTFRTVADLRDALEIQARAEGGPNNSISISVNSSGKLQLENTGIDADDYDVNLKFTGISTGSVTNNYNFTTAMSALNSFIPKESGGIGYSQSFNAATHSSSVDVFDSLGSKHTLRTEFRKVNSSEWAIKISVPEPASIDSVSPKNEKTGVIKFNSDGSLATFSPPNIAFSSNNGSAGNQQIDFDFGTINAFDGMTSFDGISKTSNIYQDGYSGGDLIGIRIDQSGTLMGSFSNGRSFGLGQIGMAKFTNNEGLSSQGGNVYDQTANSGDPIIGSAASAGRGSIRSSHLESSNVDLSSALTQLIIVQRGYQANGKTITTSDQLLQTLIGLKN